MSFGSQLRDARKKANLTHWTNLIDTVDHLKDEIEIALVGKFGNTLTYKFIYK